MASPIQFEHEQYMQSLIIKNDCSHQSLFNNKSTMKILNDIVDKIIFNYIDDAPNF